MSELLYLCLCWSVYPFRYSQSVHHDTCHGTLTGMPHDVPYGLSSLALPSWISWHLVWFGSHHLGCCEILWDPWWRYPAKLGRLWELWPRWVWESLLLECYVSGGNLFMPFSKGMAETSFTVVCLSFIFLFPLCSIDTPSFFSSWMVTVILR